MRMVKAVIQIVGHSAVPATPRNSDDLTEWYRKVPVTDHLVLHFGTDE